MSDVFDNVSSPLSQFDGHHRIEGCEMDKDYSSHSDEELMGMYQEGDYLAFEALYYRHSGRVFKYLTQRNAPEARDLLQQVFLKMHRSRHQYSTQYPFLPWLFAVTRNALLDSHKLAANKISQQSSDLRDGILPEAPALTPAVLNEELALALKTLPLDQRRAIELRYLSEWSFEQIAADIKTSPANARQLVSRAVKKLRRSFSRRTL